MFDWMEQVIVFDVPPRRQSVGEPCKTQLLLSASFCLVNCAFVFCLCGLSCLRFPFDV